jgi:polar amino acid transport system permease protein
VDLIFIEKYAPLYLEAAVIVLKLCFWGALFSVVLGFLCALVKYFNIPVLYQIVSIYIELSRNTPLLIQLFFLYFGLPRIGIHIGSFSCALLGLTFLGGSYMAEAFRGGFEAVQRGQIEAGLSIGLSRPQVITYVVLPQSLAIAFPSIAANIIFLLKETSLVSVVALADLMFVAKDLIGMYYKTNEALFMLVVSYLALILPLSFLLRFIERRLRFAGFGI